VEGPHRQLVCGHPIFNGAQHPDARRAISRRSRRARGGHRPRCRVITELPLSAQQGGLESRSWPIRSTTPRSAAIADNSRMKRPATTAWRVVVEVRPRRLSRKVLASCSGRTALQRQFRRDPCFGPGGRPPRPAQPAPSCSSTFLEVSGGAHDHSPPAQTRVTALPKNRLEVVEGLIRALDSLPEGDRAIQAATDAASARAPSPAGPPRLTERARPKRCWRMPLRRLTAWRGRPCAQGSRANWPSLVLYVLCLVLRPPASTTPVAARRDGVELRSLKEALPPPRRNPPGQWW